MDISREGAQEKEKAKKRISHNPPHSACYRIRHGGQTGREIFFTCVKLLFASTQDVADLNCGQWHQDGATAGVDRTGKSETRERLIKITAREKVPAAHQVQYSSV